MEVKQQHLCACAENDKMHKERVAALAEPQLRAGKSQGAISSRKGDGGGGNSPAGWGCVIPVGTCSNETLPSRSCTQSCPHQRHWVHFSQTFSTLSLCPAHFSLHGKLFSSRCSYLELSNCLQLYEHHIKNTNKGTKNMGLCSIMPWLTGAKNLTMHWEQHTQHLQAQLPQICLSKSSTKPWAPLIFRLFSWFELVVTPLWGWAWGAGPGQESRGEIFATGQEPPVTCAQNDHCLFIFLSW